MSRTNSNSILCDSCEPHRSQRALTGPSTSSKRLVEAFMRDILKPCRTYIVLILYSLVCFARELLQFQLNNAVFIAVTFNKRFSSQLK